MPSDDFVDHEIANKAILDVNVLRLHTCNRNEGQDNASVYSSSLLVGPGTLRAKFIRSCRGNRTSRACDFKAIYLSSTMESANV